MKGMFIHIACALFLLTAAGCLSPRGSSEEVHTYQLSLDGWGSEAQSGKKLDGPVLLVSEPQAEPGFETQRMVYLKRPYELEYYAVNQWAETPVRMLAPLMVQALNRTGAWRAVIPSPSSIQGDYRLDTYGFLIQQEFQQQPSRVRVMARAQLVDLNASTILGIRAFEVVENAASDTPYGGVQGANRAVASLLEQIAAWLRECTQHSPECRR